MIVSFAANTQNPAVAVVADQHQCGMDAWYSSGGNSDLTAASSLCLLRRHTSLRSSSAVSMPLLPTKTAYIILQGCVQIDKHTMLYTADLHANWI